MSLRVTAAAADHMLCTRADVKTRLGISGSTYDAIIDGAIVAVSSAIEKECGRIFARQTYSETLRGLGRVNLVLAQYPIDADSTTATVDDTAVTDYSVTEHEIGILWRDSGWDISSPKSGQDSESNVVIAYKAGYVLPNWISEWTAGATKAVGEWSQVKSGSTPVKDLLFECTNAGTTDGSTEPTWPTSAGATVTDNGVVWTARHASELPADLEEAALVAAISWYRGDATISQYVKRERLGPQEIEYHAENAMAISALPMMTRYVIGQYRDVRAA